MALTFSTSEPFIDNLSENCVPAPWDFDFPHGEGDGVDDSTTRICNSSGGNGTGMGEPDPYYFYEVEQLTFLGILLFVIVVGNFAVLGVLVLAKTQRKSRMNFFIMHLALADLSVGLINVLTDIIWKLTVEWYFGNTACKIIKYFQTVVIYSSNYVLVALSIDRYDAITHPLKFSGSWRRARILIAMAWFLSLVFATPALFIFRETNEIPGGDSKSQCWADLEPYKWRIYITIVFVILFMIPALIIAVCYTQMVHTIWSQSHILTPQSNTNSNSTSNGFLRKSTVRKPDAVGGGAAAAAAEDDSRRASSRGLIPKAKIKSVKMTFVIVFVFILCSSPYFVFSFLQVYEFIPKTKAMNAAATFFQSLSPLNSAANPIIYCLFSTHICRNLRKIRLVDWLALKFCPSLGRPSRQSSANRRKFGPVNHNQGISVKTRSDFTSMTGSIMKSGTVKNTLGGRALAHGPLPRIASAIKYQTDFTCVVDKDVLFHREDSQNKLSKQLASTSHPLAPALPIEDSPAAVETLD